MVKQWMPYEQALSEVEARLAEMLPDETAGLANLEELANRQLQSWLADGLLDATAWQLIWERGQGAFGAGRLGSHFPDGEAINGTSDQQTVDAKPILIPSYWWRMWLSSDNASRQLFHYSHHRGTRRKADGSGIEWIGRSFWATDAKLSTNGVGELWRVIQVERAKLTSLLEALVVLEVADEVNVRSVSPLQRSIDLRVIELSKLGDRALKQLTVKDWISGLQPVKKPDGTPYRESTITREIEAVRRALLRSRGLGAGRAEGPTEPETGFPG